MRQSNWKTYFFRLLLIGFVIVGSAYVSVVLIVYFNQESILFQSRPVSPQMKKAHAMFAVEKNGADGVLRGWHLRPEEKNLILYFGGNAEELSYLVSEFEPYSGYSVLLLNYRGYGESDGNPSERGLFADAVAIYDSHSSKYEKIFLIGRSLGTGVATYLTSVREVAAVALVTPYDSITKTAQDAMKWLPMTWIVKHRFNSLQAAQKVTKPGLFIVAEKDEIIGRERTERLFGAWNGKKKWILRKGHRHNSYSLGLAGGGEIYRFFENCKNL